jgi:4-diphosphocytidyl-2-C-methyl-D-erythritol kinase
MRARAFAKINLSLRVLGMRADGYHELRTVFQSISLHDTLTLDRRRGPFALTCNDPACPVDDANLVWRAADEMWTAARRRGRPRDVSVDLEKRIPIEGGLGGGSSDGAAALRLFARLWRVPDGAIRAAARRLGADIPYFLEGGTVLGLERGDLLYPLMDHAPAWVVVVAPGFGVSTREAFAWWDADARTAGESGEPGRRRRAGDEQVAYVNDLEGPVAAHHPEIADVARALRRAGAMHAAMTGSGSAVFGLFDHRGAAARAAGALTKQKQGRRVLVARTLNRSRYQRLAAT